VSRVYRCDVCGAFAESMAKNRWLSLRAYTGEVSEDDDDTRGFFRLINPKAEASEFMLCSLDCLATFASLQALEAEK
jgi:hypothetical protein